jgi:hypothetical protein
MKRHRSDPKSTGVAGDIDRELTDTVVASARTVRAYTRPRHYRSVAFHNDSRVTITSFGDPGLHLIGGPWDSLESSCTVLDPLVVDPGNCRSIASIGQTHRVRAI